MKLIGDKMSEKPIDEIVAEIIKRLGKIWKTRQILHCDKCHHEWDSCLGTICDWCGGNGK